jgi:DNA-directed RNA polymerase specialized sigma24 family protein
MTSDIVIANKVNEDATVFQLRFSRCRHLLHFIATRVLGGFEGAEQAVENCWLTASRNPPRFEYEAAFRSWLLRVLTDEALAIRRQNEETIESGTLVERIPSHEIRREYIRDAQRRTSIEIHDRFPPILQTAG